MTSTNFYLCLILLFVFSSGNLPAKEPNWLQDVGAKTFPAEEKIFNVTDYGALRNNLTASTEAIQKAIDECSASGGGKVMFEPGVYHTGAIFLKKNVNFIIGEGVEIRALMGLEYYPEIKTRVAGIEMMWPCGVINVLDQENVAITGKGTLHAQGKINWERYWNLRKGYTSKGLRWAADYDCKRVRTIEISNCKNITVKDITIKQSGFWTVHIMYCSQVTVDGIVVRNNIDGKGPSTDGVDVDSSTYVEVMNCDIDGNDDNYCVKAGRDADGLRVNRPAEYVYFHDCVARRGGGALIIGSETSGWIRHVKAENMKVFGSGHIIHLKSALTRGGGIEDVEISNSSGDSIKNFCKVTVNWNPSYSYAELPKGVKDIPDHWKVMLEATGNKGIPIIRNITIRDCSATNVKEDVISIEGSGKSKIENFVVENVKVSAVRAGTLKFANNWKLKNVEITTPDGDKLRLESSENIQMDQCTYSKID
jgi:polygalacturonase